MSRRVLTIIGRTGATTQIPDHSNEELSDMARRSGLEEMMERGAASPADLMQAVQSFERMAGIERFDAPPEDVMRRMSLAGQAVTPADPLRDSAEVKHDDLGPDDDFGPEFG